MLAGLSFQVKAEIVFRKSDQKFCSLPYSPEINQEYYNQIVRAFLAEFFAYAGAYPEINIRIIDTYITRKLMDALLDHRGPTEMRLYNDCVDFVRTGRKRPRII